MGKKSDLSPRKVAEVQLLLKETDYSQRVIASKVKISQKSVSRIKMSLQENGSYGNNRAGKCGAKPILTPRSKRKLVSLSLRNRKLTSKELSDQMKQDGIDITPSSVRKALIKAGLPARRPRKKAKITPRMAKARILWAKSVEHMCATDWEKVCFSDESIFQVSDECSQYIRRRPGEEFQPECVAQTVKHPTSVMVWSIFSVHAPGRLYIVEGTMRKEQYIKVLENRMIPQFLEWFPNGDGIFMHDKAPCHNAKIVHKFLQEKNIPVLPWPGNSPDMNPIENLWSIVKQELKKKKITTKQNLIEELIRVWHHNNEIQESCKTLVHSMPTRVKCLLKSKGLFTKY